MKEKQRPKAYVQIYHDCGADCDNCVFEEGKCDADADFTTAEKVAALTAALEELGGGWQPIETAPKDGTVVDLLIDGKRTIDCCYEHNQWYKVMEEGTRCILWSKITHWMPLPKPPKE